MHLNDHLGPEAFRLKPVVNLDHGDLDQLRRRTLDGGINRHPFIGATQPLVTRHQAGHIAAAAHQGRDVAVLPGLMQKAVDEQPDTGVSIEIAVDQFASFLDGDVQLLGHAERSRPVHDAKIHHLGGPALVGGHFLRRHPEDNGGRQGVDIAIVQEGLDQGRLTGQVGHNAQFDLRIVRRKNAPARFLGPKGFANLAAQLGADGDILEIGVGAGKPPGSGHCLVERAVYAAGLGQYQDGEGVDVSGLELLDHPVVQDQARQGMLRPENLQDVHIGAALADLFESQLIEKHHSQLLGGIDVELGAGCLVNPLFQHFQVSIQLQ